MILLIRNMESDRCISIVRDELKNLEVNYKSVELGEVELSEGISEEKLQVLNNTLKKSGLELVVSNKTFMINRIKEAVKQLVYYSDDLKRPNFSDYLSKKINYDYNYLSKIFSEMEDITIEKYYISQRIERAKEMLRQKEISLSEIAYKLLYSSVAHLSNQFKKVTGMTPFNFRHFEDKSWKNTVNV